MKPSRLLFAVLLLSISTFAIAADAWQTLAPGLAYQKIPLEKYNSPGNLHAFRIDLKKYQLDLAFAPDHQLPVAYIQTFVEKNNALIGVNGGFFGTNAKPLGLRFKSGKLRNEKHPTKWWSIFFITQNKAHIVPQSQFKPNASIAFAVQAGPRLLVDGNIPRSLKKGEANRTGLGIDRSQQIIMVASENASLSLNEFAKVLKEQLHCHQAINLDGGRSTQLYAAVGKFNVSVSNLSPVTDAVLVMNRSK